MLVEDPVFNALTQLLTSINVCETLAAHTSMRSLPEQTKIALDWYFLCCTAQRYVALHTPQPASSTRQLASTTPCLAPTTDTRVACRYVHPSCTYSGLSTRYILADGRHRENRDSEINRVSALSRTLNIFRPMQATLSFGPIKTSQMRRPRTASKRLTKVGRRDLYC